MVLGFKFQPGKKIKRNDDDDDHHHHHHHNSNNNNHSNKNNNNNNNNKKKKKKNKNKKALVISGNHPISWFCLSKQSIFETPNHIIQQQAANVLKLPVPKC